jgi:hypothetical protein
MVQDQGGGLVDLNKWIGGNPQGNKGTGGYYRSGGPADPRPTTLRDSAIPAVLVAFQVVDTAIPTALVEVKTF